MYEVTEREIKRKIGFQNPWWETGEIDEEVKKWTPRPYLNLFFGLLEKPKARRAVVLMGPRRVGKTYMIYHAIQRLLDQGTPKENLVYLSVDDPTHTGIRLEKLLEIALGKRLTRDVKDLYVFFDEVQYLKDWERHLKALVDQYRGITFVASGSAAAALKLKSTESGAGRFTDFLLPPLTFYEYLMLQGKEDLFGLSEDEIEKFNSEFIKYINYGGYPEAIFSEEIQADPGRYIRSDIIDKVLLRDLPSLYGITDVQELNRLFTTLAYNTGNEVSLDGLSKNSGVAKPTIKKYIEFLESAFLIRRLPRIDDKAKRFKRAVTFKVHLTNPSMRCALFGPVDAESEFMGNLVETAVFSQYMHTTFVECICYARWDKGEVDIVTLVGGKPTTCVEVKWSDSYIYRKEDIEGFISFIKRFSKHVEFSIMTTKSIVKMIHINKDVAIRFFPASSWTYSIGKSSIESKEISDYLPDIGLE